MFLQVDLDAVREVSGLSIQERYEMNDSDLAAAACVAQIEPQQKGAEWRSCSVQLCRGGTALRLFTTLAMI